MYEELALYIDGEFRQGSDGAGEDVINPATEETLAFLPHASRSDLDRALESAAAGFKVWRDTSAYERGRVLWKAGELIRERADAIGRTLTMEEGKTLGEAILEVKVAADIFQWYAENRAPAWATLAPLDEQPRPARKRAVSFLPSTPAGRADQAEPPIRFPAVAATSGAGRPCCSSTGECRHVRRARLVYRRRIPARR